MEDYKKKYEEALENFKKIKAANKDNKELVNFIEYEYPELKESEDEKIRKKVIDVLKLNIRGAESQMQASRGVDRTFEVYACNKVITWLEKQGKESVVTDVLIKAGLKPYKDGNKWCILVGDNIQEGICGFGDTIDEALFEFLKELVENQGEQKSEEFPNGEDYGIDSLYHAERILEKTLGEVEGYQSDDGILEHKCAIEAIKRLYEQKPVDKVEPKFKVGDWVVPNNGEPRVFRVEERGWPDSIISDSLGNQFVNTFTLDKQYHLWTIQDAKKGDILSYDKSKCIAMFLKIESVSFKDICYVGAIDGKFYIGGWHDIENAHPAPKEQRDLLFAKMKEAGYEWDAEKKELKKIEQKPAWSEEDEVMIERLNNCLDELKEVNGWLYTYVNNKDVELDKIRNWLQSIKYRVQPQPKPAWSEEDERLIEFLISHFSICHPYRSFKFDINTDLTTDEIIERIRNLSSQSQWKPTDEQMEALYTYIYNPQYFNSPDPRMELVESVYKDLKKLREE